MVHVRGISADEWREVKQQRLRALSDPQAAIAFFTTLEEAEQRPDEWWQNRAVETSVEAPEPALTRQFLAVDDDGSWMGTATVHIQSAGENDFDGTPLDHDRGQFLAVFVEPGHRGKGVLRHLVDAGLEWLGSRHVTEASLWVHEDNVGAQCAYTRAGFWLTGQRVVDKIGPEVAMKRDVPPIVTN